jgi:twitching motility protein PilU
VSDLIFKGEVHALKEQMAKSKEQGMQTFDQALFDLHEIGEIGYEDALRNADSVNELKLNIKLNSRRARAEDSRPKIELSLHEEKKASDEPPPLELFARPAPAMAAANPARPA